MPSMLGSIQVAFGSDTSGLMAGINTAKSALSQFGSGNIVGGLATTLVGVGAAAVGVGIQATKMAADYQTSLTSLITGAGESASNIKMVGDGILAMSSATGTSTDQLTKGMYMIESAGYHGADGLAVLKSAAEGAKVGNADLGTVADATTTIMTDFGIKAGNSSVAVNTLIATVANGKTTMSALASSLSQIMPTASSAGISLTDTSAAMATMTGEGVPAANAATYLRQTILGLVAPSAGTKKALADVGLTTTQVSDEMKKSLPDALQMITDAVGKKFPEGSAAYVNAIKNISGGAKTMQGMLDLTGTHMATFKGNVTNISDAVQKGGNSITGWAQVQGTFNEKMDEAKASMVALMITLGQQLLPVVTQLVGYIAPLVAGFTQWLTSGNGIAGAMSALSPILQNVSGMVGIIIGNWQQFGTTLGPLMTALKQFGGVIGGTLPGFISQFLRIFNDANMVIQTVGGVIASVAVPALKILGQVIQGAQTALEPIINAVEGQFLPALQNLANAITPVITGIVSWIANSGMIPVIFNVVGHVIGFVVGVISTLITILATLITFFTQNEVGIALFRATLILVGVVLTAIAAVAIPMLIIALYGMLAAAVTTGIGIMIAWAPIVLPILAIIAVIAAVILVVQHFGQIGHWLQSLWAPIGTWFGNLWNSILGGIRNFIGSVQTGFQAFLGVLGNIVRIGLKVIFDLFFAPFLLIGALFQWLYAHNTYFQKLVDAIRAIITAGLAWLTNAWKAFGAWFQSALESIKSFVSTIWNSIVSFLVGVWNNIIAFIRQYGLLLIEIILGPLGIILALIIGHWNQITAFLQAAWAWILNAAQSAWNAVVGVFSSVWNSISSVLSGLWNNISNWFGNLAGQMVQFGQNLIQGLINGIGSMLGAVGNAVGNVANTVKNFLGFHSPAKMGPGAELDVWGPNLAKGFASGLEKGIPMVQAAVTHLVQPTAQLGVSSSSSGSAGSASNASQSSGTPVVLQIDGQTFATLIAPHMGKAQQKITVRTTGRGW